MKKKVGKALVVGAGISGIRSALDLAEVGYGVTLIDRSPHMGGILSQLDYQFPTDQCGMCKMLPMVDRDASSQYCLRKGLFHENIDILLSTELMSVEGEAGNYTVSLRQKPTWVDASLCIGCGACVDVCPVEVANEFNLGLAKRKAIYLPVPHAIPNPYVIDTLACNRCGACEPVCPTGAIRLSEQERKKFRILVVDDELILRDSLRDWLDDEEGFSVDTAESGPAALALLKEQSYQLMLLDIKMPEMDGVEVLAKAKEILPDLPVVMMTAYATVETAIEAMKTGAHDYLIKPFDTEVLIPKIVKIYENGEAAKGAQLDVGAIVLCGGTDYFDPATGKNTLGYHALPGVVTSLEFERIISGSGPCQGRLIRPEDGKPVKKIAWIQCVGSRDLQTNSDFCSNVCCMFAIKEALVAKEKFGDSIDATIYYMDMRTFGKPYQRYRDNAEKVRGVHFERGRVHSVTLDGTVDEGDRRLAVRYAAMDGKMRDDTYDMVVLAVGQRPAEGTTELAEALDIPLNPWGFFETESFSMAQTKNGGILIGGAYAGLKDISESVIQASAAALSASQVIHSNGGSLALESEPPAEMTDVTREVPRILITVCTCGDSLTGYIQQETMASRFNRDPIVCGIEFVDNTCTAHGWEQLEGLMEKYKPNRLLIGACLPYLYTRKVKELGRRFGLGPALMEVVDIRTPSFPLLRSPENADTEPIAAQIESALRVGLARLKRIDSVPVSYLRIAQRALVVGGGIAGMTAALGIAGHGFEVDLVEQGEQLGGNLNWLQTTLDGHTTQAFLEETISKVEKHPLITVHTRSQVVGSYGAVGNFTTTIESEEKEVSAVHHGVVILAAGGKEAATSSYHYGESDAVITQKEFEGKLADGSLAANAPSTVVMIQCVDSREEPRNYCSRVCCASALKHALAIKETHPDTTIYILYRDMMTYGFMETYFTKARQAGIIFIQYQPEEKPEVVISEDAGNAATPLQVNAFDPVLKRNVQIHTDMVVLSVGIIPNLVHSLANVFGADVDEDGFFKEAEFKWRPVDALKEGVFACGLSHSPRAIPETVASAEAASQRSLRILTQERLPAGKVVASVRHSLCSLCERCIDACPYGARTIDADLEKVLVNPVMCQGCGACAAVCPNSASVVAGFHEEQVLEMIDASLTGSI